MFLLGRLCPWSHVSSRGSLSRGVSVWGLCPGGYLSRRVSVWGGAMSRGSLKKRWVSVLGVSVEGGPWGLSVQRGLCRQVPPPESEKWVVRILLKCILVIFILVCCCLSAVLICLNFVLSTFDAFFS